MRQRANRQWRLTAGTLIICLTLLGFFTGSLFLLAGTAMAMDADAIIGKVEDNLNGKTAVMDLTMVVKTKRVERTVKMRSYSIGREKSFIKILYPGKDKGITFLKIDNAMWQYVPRIEKTIKIPASMMLQSWMGSDFTNDDLVRESSINSDYSKKLLAESADEYTVELIPREEAAVVWGRIVMGVSKQYFLPTTVFYYDEMGVVVRKLVYSEVQPCGDRFYPTRWWMFPMEADKADHETSITIANAVCDAPVDESYFSKRALKRYAD